MSPPARQMTAPLLHEAAYREVESDEIDMETERLGAGRRGDSRIHNGQTTEPDTTQCVRAYVRSCERARSRAADSEWEVPGSAGMY
jgi:hypothetical protein